MKDRKSISIPPKLNHLDFLSEELIFTVLDLLPLDRKSFSLVCISFYNIESRHRKDLKPLRSEHLIKILKRYPNVSNLDLSLCPRISDASLGVIAEYSNKMLRSINLSRSKFFSHVGLSNLVTNCVNLVAIDLSNATDLTDFGASAIAEAKNLEKLWLVRCKNMSDIGIGRIAVGCRKLKLLNLKWCVNVGDLGVKLVAVKCKEITSLDLSFVPITSKCLSQILELQYLEDLVLEGCFGVDDDGLIDDLNQQCKSLQRLDMSSCLNISPAGLSSLANAAGCLQNLNLSFSNCVDITVADSLHKLSMLQSVKLDGCEVTCSGLKAIGNFCVSLKELSLKKCMGVTDEGLSFLVTKQKELRKLDISCCRKITQVSLTRITSSCTSLTSLKMESCILVLAEAFVSIGERCPFLEELDLTDNEIDDQGLKSISRCPQLSSLKLGICHNITDEGLIHVGQYCSNLKELDLYRPVGITDSSIFAVSRGCPSLEVINIAYCESITDRSLISLSKCSRLNTLEIRACTLITSLGLAAIAKGCKQLARLDIKKCHKIDDSGMIPHAQFSQNLKQINLSYTSVTDVGLLSLSNISCLQSITALHLNGFTPRGLSVALLACGGLSKVKLHASFKPLFPQIWFDHLEARGCTFYWRNKLFQAELNPKCWKLQLADLD